MKSIYNRYPRKKTYNKQEEFSYLSKILKIAQTVFSLMHKFFKPQIRFFFYKFSIDFSCRHHGFVLFVYVLRFDFLQV